MTKQKNLIQRFGLIVTARSNSSRLPNKHFYKINKKTLLEYLISRAKKIINLNHIIVATTINDSDNKIEKLSKKKNIDCFRGSELDVAKRVYHAAKKFKLDVVCLITADCPIFDIELVNDLVINFKKNSHIIDYASLQGNIPNGMDCEIFKTTILKDSIKNRKFLDEKEHVTLNIRRNKKKYRLFSFIPPKKYSWPNLALTVDEKNDFYLIKRIIDYFNKRKNYYFNCLDVIELLKKNKDWLKINNLIKRNDKNIKI